MEEVGFKVAIVRPLDVIRHNYTTYRITLRCYQLRLEGEPKGCPVPEELTEATACQWIAPQDIEAFPLPAPHRKLADNCSLLTTRPQASSFCPRREARGRQPWREPRNISGVSPHAQDCLLD